ncbi:unnamed protein product [Mesocestoides corti]|uniref:GAR domain-containing protein n=1 Tax=Mesocestoides corti TaxID=53468 RepID=A0A3P6HVG3_MESCO|nr:unnamed protein product [Mesocestoides corti]
MLVHRAPATECLRSVFGLVDLTSVGYQLFKTCTRFFTRFTRHLKVSTKWANACGAVYASQISTSSIKVMCKSMKNRFRWFVIFLHTTLCRFLTNVAFLKVRRQTAKCTCCSRNRLVRLDEGRYQMGSRIYYLRRFRSHIMVRVGGGWLTLPQFLDRYDPCRQKEGNLVTTVRLWVCVFFFENLHTYFIPCSRLPFYTQLFLINFGNKRRFPNLDLYF